MAIICKNASKLIPRVILRSEAEQHKTTIGVTWLTVQVRIHTNEIHFHLLKCRYWTKRSEHHEQSSVSCRSWRLDHNDACRKWNVDPRPLTGRRASTAAIVVPNEVPERKNKYGVWWVHRGHSRIVHGYFIRGKLPGTRFFYVWRWEVSTLFIWFNLALDGVERATFARATWNKCLNCWERQSPTRNWQVSAYILVVNWLLYLAMIKIATQKSNDKINFKDFVDFFYKVDWKKWSAAKF